LQAENSQGSIKHECLIIVRMEGDNTNELPDEPQAVACGWCEYLTIALRLVTASIREHETGIAEEGHVEPDYEETHGKLLTERDQLLAQLEEHEHRGS
jgi:hypothetical protein